VAAVEIPKNKIMPLENAVVRMTPSGACLSGGQGALCADEEMPYSEPLRVPGILKFIVAIRPVGRTAVAFLPALASPIKKQEQGFPSAPEEPDPLLRS
jgi:hypothetical protein